jgi:hypothetical protein
MVQLGTARASWQILRTLLLVHNYTWRRGTESVLFTGGGLVKGESVLVLTSAEGVIRCLSVV